MAHPRYWLFLILTMALMNTGCLFINAEVNPSYTAGPIQKSPLENLRPVNIALLVDDQRPSESRQLAIEGAYQDALNNALRGLVRSFARDAEVIKALQISSPNN